MIHQRCKGNDQMWIERSNDWPCLQLQLQLTVVRMLDIASCCPMMIHNALAMRGKHHLFVAHGRTTTWGVSKFMSSPVSYMLFLDHLPANESCHWLRSLVARYARDLAFDLTVWWLGCKHGSPGPTSWSSLSVGRWFVSRTSPMVHVVVSQAIRNSQNVGLLRKWLLLDDLVPPAS